MGVQDAQYRTITCNTCEKTATFDMKEAQKTLEVPENVWMKALRFVTAVDGRSFAYCSDVCEIENIKSGVHNAPEAKKVIDAPATPGAIKAAAAAAEAAEKATKALKAGTGVTLG